MPKTKVSGSKEISAWQKVDTRRKGTTLEREERSLRTEKTEWEDT